jgi:hypothetical protein
MFVNRKSPGAFILSRKGRAADFVGAGPQDVGGSISQVSRQASYRYFWFVYTDTAQEAFHLAMTWFHRFRPTDNEAAPPRASADWRCTAEGCASCALLYSGH